MVIRQGDDQEFATAASRHGRHAVAPAARSAPPDAADRQSSTVPAKPGPDALAPVPIDTPWRRSPPIYWSGVRSSPTRKSPISGDVELASRAADRTGDGAAETLRRDSRVVAGKRAEVQRLLHLGRDVRHGQRGRLRSGCLNSWSLIPLFKRCTSRCRTRICGSRSGRSRLSTARTRRRRT
jgi:hypothetical protein